LAFVCVAGDLAFGAAVFLAEEKVNDSVTIAQTERRIILFVFIVYGFIIVFFQNYSFGSGSEPPPVVLPESSLGATTSSVHEVTVRPLTKASRQIKRIFFIRIIGFKVLNWFGLFVN